jgi:hypothetical protein
MSSTPNNSSSSLPPVQNYHHEQQRNNNNNNTMLNNNSEQFPPVMSQHRSFDPTTSTGMAHINTNTAPINPTNPTTTTTTTTSPADDTTTNNANNAINILHHFKNGIDDMDIGGVTEPLPTDVICGRGKMTSSHPANRRFRELVDSHKREYQNSKRRDEKTRITCDLVDKLRSEGR